MSSNADLARMGMEGFAIIDAYHGKKTKPNPPKPYVSQESKPKADLARIGKEGFAIIDAYHGKKTKPNPPKPYVSQEPKPTRLYQYQTQQVKPNEIMNCYEVLQFNEGVTVKDYRRQSQAMAY